MLLSAGGRNSCGVAEGTRGKVLEGERELTHTLNTELRPGQRDYRRRTCVVGEVQTWQTLIQLTTAGFDFPQADNS